MDKSVVVEDVPFAYTQSIPSFPVSTVQTYETVIPQLSSTIAWFDVLVKFTIEPSISVPVAELVNAGITIDVDAFTT